MDRLKSANKDLNYFIILWMSHNPAGLGEDVKVASASTCSL